MSFLSQENAQYISDIFQKFMMDKYQFRYTSLMTQEEYLKLLGTTMTKIYREHKHQLEIGDLNKRTMSELKNECLARMASASKNVAPPTLTPSSSSASPLPPFVPPPLETVPEEPVGFSEDSEFFNRLQRLELQRKTFTATSSVVVPSFPPAEQNTPSQNATSQVPNAITTVFMPSPLRIGKEIKIYSWQRNWMDSPSRNDFIWNGPLPRQADNTNTRVGCVVAPKHILHQSGLLSLRIEGANEDEVNITLVPSHIVGEYAIYRPVLESLSYLQLLALPWKISLEAGDGESLYLGEDGRRYSLVEEREGFFQLQIEGEVSFCGVGDSLRLFEEASKKILSARVIAQEGREVRIACSGKIHGKGQVLNYSHQVSLVFEMVRSEHKN